MSKTLSSSLKLALAVFLVFLLVFNLQFAVPQADGTEEADEETDGSRILSDEEVQQFGLTAPPTRGEPWKQWERYGYHPGGENGAAVLYGDRIYMIMGGSPGWQGGYNDYDDIFYYNLTTDEWVALEQSFRPGGRGYFGDAYDNANDKLILYGGYESGSMQDDLWEFDLKTETWSRLLSSGVLEPTYKRRARAPAVIDTTDNSFYIHMGRADSTEPVDNLTGFYKIDLNSPSSGAQSLRDGTGMGMVERYEHDMCIDESDRKIYMYGGYNENWGYQTEFWVYDIRNNVWNPIPTHPDMYRLFGARMFFRQSDGTVNIWGGRMSGNSENELLWTYDVDTGAWTNTSYTDVPAGRLYYANHYSPQEDTFVVFAGRYYSGGDSGRYRDLNYLDMDTGDWTSFPLKYESPDETNGIFAFDDARQRIYYISQMSPGGWGANGTEYFYYWDIAQKDWMGPFYNTGSEGPRSISNSGICFDKANMTVYLYGGGWTEGRNPTRYYDYNGFWKIDLNTYEWTLLIEEAGPQKRQGFPMVFNPNDGLIYMYGGYHHFTTSGSDEAIRDDFYKFDPRMKFFQPLQIPLGTTPGGRKGAALCLIEEENILYLFGGVENSGGSPTDERDLWRYDITTGTWTELARSTSSRIYGKLVYDPLIRELYLTGGANDDLIRYRILEDKWYTDWYPDPNPGTLNGHACHFDPVERDLWIFGGSKSGIWRMGIPPRLAIQTVDFKDPDKSEDIAYAMYRPYTFSTRIKVMNGREDLSRIEMNLPHKQGVFRVSYNSTVGEMGGNAWTEFDPFDVAELVGIPSATWNGLFLNIEFQLKFHWNWTHKGSSVERFMKVEALGIDIGSDVLYVRDFLRIRNTLKFRGSINLEGVIQGSIEDGDWVQNNEEITVYGPVVTYSDSAEFFPPSDTYDLDLWMQNEKIRPVNVVAGEQINITFTSPDNTSGKTWYVLNISDLNEATGNEELKWNISVDPYAPEAPSNLIFHDESPDDTSMRFDNDLDVILTWQSPLEPLSGVKTYYWDYQDGGGTRNGIPVNKTQLELTLPESGPHTIYIWTEDEVGNIGPSANKSVHVDMEEIQFRIVSPDINQTIPYEVLDIVINMTDLGGSLIDIKSVQYRFSNDGQGDDNWIGADAWKYMTTLWELYGSDTDIIEFSISLGKGGVPKLLDSDENFLQIRARDGAGTMFRSPIYNIDVDISLRFPVATLIAPEDKTSFDNEEDVLLEWEVDFFDPNDVTYNIYISDVKKKVELWDTDIRRTVIDGLSYQPDFLHPGTFYWTVIPVAQGQWEGSCDNGIWEFTLTSNYEYQFTVVTEDRMHKYEQGQAGIPMTFTLTNDANDVVWIRPSSDLGGFATIEWQDLDPQERKYRLGPSESKDVNGLLFILSTTTVGAHEMSFYFENQYGVNKSVSIDVDVVDVAEPPSNNGGSEIDFGLMMAFLIVGIVVLMLIIAAVYFLVFKKKKTGSRASEEQLARIEKEMMGEDKTDRSLATAPQPKGLGSSISRSIPKEGEDVPEMEEWDESEAEEEIKLVEEGSEDDWMNLVAAETVAAESKPEIVEDRMVESDKEKSLTDLLSEMSEDVEIEDP